MYKISITIVLLGLIFAFGTGCGSSYTEGERNYSTSYVYGEWETALPEDRGVDIEAASRVLSNITGDPQIRSFLVVKDGFIVYEHYADGYDQDSMFNVFSNETLVELHIASFMERS